MNTPSFQDLEILIFIPVLETTGYTTFPLRGSFHVCCDEPLFFKAGESQLECINLSEQVCISLSERYRKLLNAFSKITLTIIETGDSVVRHLTPLSQLQREILKHLGLSVSIYDKLEVMS